MIVPIFYLNKKIKLNSFCENSFLAKILAKISEKGRDQKLQNKKNDKKKQKNKHQKTDEETNAYTCILLNKTSKQNKEGNNLNFIQ